MKSARLSPGQDPEEFLYELDTRRERLNACDLHPPSPSAGVRAHPHIPLREARLRDRRHSPHNARALCDQPCPSELDDGSFGDQGCHARGRRQPQRHNLQLLRTRGSFREHVSPPRQVRAAATTTKATERTAGRTVSTRPEASKRHASCQATEGGCVRTTTLLTAATPTTTP